MTGKKAPKAPGNAKRTFAENVKRLMDEHFEREANKPMSLAKAAGVSLSTIQRAIDGEHAPTLDTVEAIALALKIQPFELLRKNSAQHPVRRTGT